MTIPVNGNTYWPPRPYGACWHLPGISCDNCPSYWARPSYPYAVPQPYIIYTTTTLPPADPDPLTDYIPEGQP